VSSLLTPPSLVIRANQRNASGNGITGCRYGQMQCAARVHHTPHLPDRTKKNGRGTTAIRNRVMRRWWPGRLAAQPSLPSTWIQCRDKTTARQTMKRRDRMMVPPVSGQPSSLTGMLFVRGYTQQGMERETRFELATFCLGSRHSTAELLPPMPSTGRFYDSKGQNTRPSRPATPADHKYHPARRCHLGRRALREHGRTPTPSS
jgi:hypothetical protein